MEYQYKYIKLLGLNISLINLDDLLEYIKLAICSKSKIIISHVNIYAMNIACTNSRFKRLLNNSKILFNDSYGIRLAAKITNKLIPPKNTPPDWIDDLSLVCVENNFSLYLLGGENDTSKIAADKLKHKYPKLKIAGTQHGYFNKEFNSKEHIKVIEDINDKKPDILMVGFGMPLQEFWIEDNFNRINASIFLPVGALFDYVSEKKYRAPKWVTSNGLEWIARLIIEPKRLWNRYIIGNPLFIYRVIMERLGINTYKSS